MLKKMWDDVVAGPEPAGGLGRLRKLNTNTNTKDEGEGSMLMASPTSQETTPKTPLTPTSAKKGDNVWRSVFNPGSNSATKSIGAEMFDKPLPNSPTVYDWLYSQESRSKHR